MTVSTATIEAPTANTDPWQDVRAMTDRGCLTVGPQLSYAIKERPDRLVFMYSRYWAAAHLIGNARTVLEVGCSEGSGAGILAAGREKYRGIDTDAVAIRRAQAINGAEPVNRTLAFVVSDGSTLANVADQWMTFDAAVSLDVIEHVPTEQENGFMAGITSCLAQNGIAVIGTPSANFDHLASPPSRVGHCNLYTPKRLEALMAEHFHTVIMAGMNDTSIHFGHPEARHYLLAVGVGPR